MRIAIAGSRKLPPGHAPRLLVLFLAHLPPDSVILLRCGLHSAPGRFEWDVYTLATSMRLFVEWRMPEPGKGREGTFFRDVDMIAESELLLAFLLPEEAMVSDSGTSHLVEKALDQHVPVYTYTLDTDGRVARWGENDPDGIWDGRVPAA